VSLDPQRLKVEWEELFDPLSEDVVFLGVTYDPPWNAGGESPAGNLWYWHIEGDFDEYEAMGIARQSEPYAGDDTPYHMRGYHPPTNARYPSDVFTWWPSRVHGEWFDLFEKAMRSDPQRMKALIVEALEPSNELRQ
jgi:hypothetical protein